MWILISSCDESCPFVGFYPYDTSSSTYGFNHGFVHLWIKLWTRPLVDPSTLIMVHKSFLWNEFVLFMDFINPSTLMMGPSTCEPSNIKVFVLLWTLWLQFILLKRTCPFYGLINPSTLWTHPLRRLNSELVRFVDFLWNSFTLWSS